MNNYFLKFREKQIRISKKKKSGRIIKNETESQLTEIRLLPKQTNHPQPPSIPFLFAFSRFIVFRFIFFLFCSLPAAYGGARRTNWTKVAGKCRAAPHRWLFHISIDYVAASSISPVLRFNVIRSTRISTHTGVTLLRLDRLALASHLLRAHTHARASTIISSSWSRRPSSSHGKILVASFSPATFFLL